MTIKKYRNDPSIIYEAVQLEQSNGAEVAEWCGGKWVNLYGRGDRGEDISHINIKTLEGVMKANIGDYVVKGIKGEFWPVKPDIFEAGKKLVEP